MFKKYLFSTAILILLLSDVLVFGHSGRTDRYGGHHDRKNGVYHYHNSGTVRRQSITPTNTENYLARRVRVRGYYRKDGTYVRPHYRTAPDGNPRNNYSYPGNYNPNTGKITPGDPQKYLDRYYNKSRNSSSSININQTSPQVTTGKPLVEQETNKSDIQTHSDLINSLQKQELERMTRNVNRPPGSDLPDEIAIPLGILIFIAIIFGLICMIYDKITSRYE